MRAQAAATKAQRKAVLRALVCSKRVQARERLVSSQDRLVKEARGCLHPVRRSAAQQVRELAAPAEAEQERGCLHRRLVRRGVRR